jgi:PHD/YefM family antitoxin component YafN of YafNO toxin-antitoxin module
MSEDRTQEFRQRAQQEQEEIEETREDLKSEQKQTPDAEYAAPEEEARDKGGEE